MRGRFMLTITLGNAAMSSRHDLAEAVEAVSVAVREGLSEGPIRDANGNKVGFYDIEAPGSPED